MTAVFIRRRKTERRRGKKAVGRQRQKGVMHPQAKERQGLPAVIFPTALKAWPCWYLAFGLLASRTVRH